jgi:rubredoxin
MTTYGYSSDDGSDSSDGKSPRRLAYEKKYAKDSVAWTCPLCALVLTKKHAQRHMGNGGCSRRQARQLAEKSAPTPAPEEEDWTCPICALVLPKNERQYHLTDNNCGFRRARQIVEMCKPTPAPPAPVEEEWFDCEEAFVVDPEVLA